MKILHLNISDIVGGAARAAHRIHKGLLAKKIQSTMLVQKKRSIEQEIQTTYESKIGKIFSVLRPKVNKKLQKLQHTSNQILHSTNLLPSFLHKKINNSDADIVHLHWINEEMISIKEISKIQKPIVWTLHDMWAFSGAEHYDNWQNPNRYKKVYSKSNRPKNYSGFDLDRWTWKRKFKYWNNLNIHFVTPSNWLADCLAMSSLFKGKNATVIPNGLDTTVFKPINKLIARNILNIPKDKKIILYGALQAKSKPIKGYSKLVEAKKYLLNEHELDELYFIVFGNKNTGKEEENGITTHYLGRIDDDVMLSLIYSSADVMVVPSIMEAFGQTVSEAMACGTPVVAFNKTGPKDIIDHKENGYLAKPFKSEDLANGINWILALSNDDRAYINKMARKKVESFFDINVVSNQYVNIYKSIL